MYARSKVNAKPNGTTGTVDRRGNVSPLMLNTKDRKSSRLAPLTNDDD